MLYPVSSDLKEVNSFYNSFSDADQKPPPGFQKLKKLCLVKRSSLNQSYYYYFFYLNFLAAFKGKVLDMERN